MGFMAFWANLGCTSIRNSQNNFDFAKWLAIFSIFYAGRKNHVSDFPYLIRYACKSRRKMVILELFLFLVHTLNFMMGLHTCELGMWESTQTHKGHSLEKTHVTKFFLGLWKYAKLGAIIVGTMSDVTSATTYFFINHH